MLSGKLHAPVILRCRQGRHRHMRFKQRNEWQEQLPVQSVLVEAFGLHIGGGHQCDPTSEQLLEQPREQHGIGDVMHVHFIQAQQPQPRLDDRLDHGLDRIGVLALGALAKRRHPCVDLVHELVKVHPPLAGYRRSGKEQVHQHGLAAPDFAMQVEAAHRASLAVKQAAKQALRLFSLQPRQHLIQQFRRIMLRRIGRQRAARHQRGISCTDRSERCLLGTG